ncbi:MAG TPA: ATP-binding cassette domain-containing protein, partial [Miltoncostaeaceae bacterium]|nr:ATP-binding cassette domain-containing protein [Miltoncostaeaceae bacterium]
MPAQPPPGTDAGRGAALSVRGLRKSFGERLVLDGLDLDVGRGESVAVLGANGSGKSTALRCVVGLETPDDGSIVVSGRNVVGLKGHDLVAARRDAAMIFQQINLVRRLS